MDEFIHYALTHGIVYGIKEPEIDQVKSKGMVIHAPFTLEPYTISRKAFLKAKSLTPLFNRLLDRISRDYDWLVSTLLRTASSDEFTGRLMEILQTTAREGIRQAISLGIIRSDYMLHSVSGDDRSLLQVEVNSIASSFGSLSTKISQMHSLLSAQEGKEIPINNALDEIAGGIALAHHRFIAQSCVQDARPVMIVQPGESNISDQRLLHFNLLEKHGISFLRLTLLEIATRAKLSDSGYLEIDGNMISVAYVSYIRIAL